MLGHFSRYLLLTGASISGDAADIVSTPGFHSDSVESTRCQRWEDTLVVSCWDTLILQHGVIVTDQNHVAVENPSRLAPVHLKVWHNMIT